jgi:ACGX-repeat protein
MFFSLCDNHDNRKAIGPTEINLTEVNIMALSNIAGWNENVAGSACGASDKPAACVASEKPAETPAACGAADKPEEKPAACGSACGAGDK